MPPTAFILILTADEEKGRRLRDQLREHHNHPSVVVDSLERALDSIRQRTPDVVVAEARINGKETAKPLADLLDRLARDATLLVLGEPAVRPTPQRIDLEVLRPDSSDESLVHKISSVAGSAAARRDDRLLQQSLAEVPAFEGIVGHTPQIRRIIERIKKAARNKLTVLILGETGTGKDLIAEAIHKQSDRSRRALKSVNCAGLNENLLESELFGHVKGAFTGAVSDRKGYFVAADGGTLFLDEVGDMPMTMQAKLLRVLERREITPVGSTEVQRVDVRVIAATNTDLRQAVEEKRFREDLYYRLKQWEINVPPLRERQQDIPLLAMHFLKRANETHGVNVPGFSADAMAHLVHHYWPGNVRELANLIEAVAVEVENRRIETDDLPESIRGRLDIVPVSAGSMVGLPLAQIERIMIERTLETTGGNREAAAKMLGIGTRTLYRKIKEYDLP
ncbi:MAG TPA: sigma-54 dependent transcriptional regulator [Phycisphaerae bacterium]|jgi:two-component system response regulator HydG|nr:sigma-54 dependent transcriptional regulator [Phycisphaerae bacterium]HPC23450.1 sigma-54 dependent transcriptional regulator [Phycisphaerae bacterium]HRS27808.1 sigma-54 dependent transcriptional regulator [Phycisphaerae bacterium]HRT42933.1 sigma-54 dependent transcriptional regulator [Phycisphaerae bacterium]